MLVRLKTKNRSRKRNKKGIYILPNLFTSCSLFGGFYAIIAAIQGRYDAAAIAILISLIFDGLDGKIARFTNTTSQFGTEYDSLSDLVAFGVAPGLLAFEWSLKSFGRFGWLAVFLYVICGALRLARFNIFINSLDGFTENKHIIIISAIYSLSFLMVSTIDYLSFKELELFKKKPFNVLVATILLFIVVAYKPAFMLFLFSTMYVISGPFITLYHLTHRSIKRAHSVTDSSLEKSEKSIKNEL
ncbi:MAG: CDP-diacylglycerol--serine O-phosphatidyltransferase [Deltaproteobacteria bacterium]|nr:CDP-diacylglycerol--serine O-phosphatidyltransferase [Deltaproteobacteria bacterium]